MSGWCQLRVPAYMAAWCRRHRTATDVGFAAAFVVLDTFVTLIGGSWWPAHPGPLAWALLAAQAAAVATLAFRRRAPIAVVAVLTAFTLVLSLLISPAGALTPVNDQTVWAPFGTVLAAYAPFFYQPNRRLAYLAVGLMAVVVARPWQPSLTVISVGLIRTAGGPLLGVYFDTRRRLIMALTERAERAEREQHLLAEQARADERARLAGEMHDVVTHRVSLMVLQAGALRVTASDAATRQAAEDLRANGSLALDELRDLVGILRTGPEDSESPADPGLDALVAESTSVGIPAELIEDGDPALASPVVRRTAYRVTREALTNVRKHAPGARVTVQVSYARAEVRLTIRNAPPPQPAQPDNGLADISLAGTGSGLGLAGLRQRIELMQGTLRAGPAADGGFCVEAVLPAFVPTPEPIS
jgi:signal transduction histidine kinase